MLARLATEFNEFGGIRWAAMRVRASLLNNDAGLGGAY